MEEHRTRRTLRRWILCALPVAALIVAQLRPVLHVFDCAVLATLDGLDALMQSAIIAWTGRHFWQPSVWVDLPIFFPAHGALTFMDSLLGQALLLWPVGAATNAGPALLYNLAVASTLVLAAAAAMVLWRAGAGAAGSAGAASTAASSASSGGAGAASAAGAGLCALALVGSPFTAWKLGMLNQIPPPWVVLLIAMLWLGWTRFQTGARTAPAWWAAAGCLIAQAAWGWYGLADAVFATGTAAVLAVRLAVRRHTLRRLLRQTAAPALVAAAGVLLLAWPYVQQRGSQPEYTRTKQEVRLFSADLADLTNTGVHRGRLADWLGRGEPPTTRAMRNLQPVLHPGWIALGLALVGFWRRRHLTPRQRGLGYLLVAIGACGLVMAFGDSAGLPPGSERRVPLPFGLLQDLLLPFRAFRAPVRFAYLAVIAVAWWAAAGLHAVWPAHRRQVAARLATGGVWLALWLESVPMGLFAAPVPNAWTATIDPLQGLVPPGAVLTLPAPRTEQQEDLAEVGWLHLAVASGRPVTGGVSGWVPPQSRSLRERLGACEDGAADPRSLLAELRAEGVVAAAISAAWSDPLRVAYWDSVLQSVGWVALPGAPTAPGAPAARFYLAGD